jgi:restriction system protein
MSARFWFVRAGERAAAIDDFRTGNLVAIGWKEVGRLPDHIDDRALARLFAERYPAEREGTRKVWLAQVKRFIKELSVGDPVATYDANQRLYYLGTIDSDTEWRDNNGLPRFRRVTWSQQVQRDVLSAPTRNTLGSIATLFRASQEASDELRARAVPIDSPATAPPPAPPAPDTDEDEGILREEVIEKSWQFIEDRLSTLDWQRMQNLVAGILRAMGYHTQVSAEGADRGVDIFASPDGLGLQEPRIFVEVKHRPGTPMSADELRSFLGGRRAGDRCLYVSTGGFTRDAKYEAERSNVPLTLITLPRLRELLIQHYERVDAETRALVPLQRLYWPVE